MTEKEMYNLINSQNNQQSNGFAVNEKERGISGVFSALMRKVYTWMTLALLITGVTAYGVASSPTLLMTLMTSRGLLFGLIIAELVRSYFSNPAYNDYPVVGLLAGRICSMPSALIFTISPGPTSYAVS